MKISLPKFVKKANSWCVTTVALNTSSYKNSTKQVQHWCSSLEEAAKKYTDLCAGDKK